MREKVKLKEAARKEIERLSRLKKGRIKPSEVVQAAKDPDSPLHEYFDWDLESAANKYWEEQARRLIKSVKVVVTTETTRITAVGYVRDPEKSPAEQGYVHVSRVRTDEDMKREVMIAEFERAAAALRRARDLSLLFDMYEQVDEFIQRLEIMKRDIHNAPVQTQ